MTPVPDVGTLAPAAPGSATVAQVAVVRVAGVPVSVVDDLAAPDTVAALRAAEEHEHAAAVLAGSLTDELYRLVPAIEDKSLRRKVVKLRRDVHNGRPPVGDVAAELPCAGDVRRWAELLGRAAGQRAAARDHLAAEVARAAKAMRGHLTTPAVSAGLALASPEFTLRLLGEPLADAPGSRSARSATAYLTRTALKTSPFSSLTTVGVTGFGVADSGRADEVPGGTRAVGSSRTHALALFLACLRDPELAGLMDVTAVDGLREVDGHWLATLPTRVVVRNTPLRVDELTDCGMYARLLADLPTDPVPLRSDHLVPDARRLAEIGLLQPVLPWPLHSGRDFAGLARWAEPGSPRFAAATRTLAEQEAIVAADHAPARRTAAIAEARTAVKDAFAALGQPVPSWTDELPLFHEVVASDPVCPRLPGTVSDDLAEIARWLVPHTWRSPRYDELVRCFVLRHGHGASGVGLLDFLYAFLRAATAGSPLPDVDLAAARDPRRLRGDRTLAASSNALFFQVAAESADQVAAGAHLTVLNAAHSGGLGLLGRWAGVHDRLGGPLAGWARRLHPGCRVYQVTPHADWASLQRPALTTLPLVRCPGDLRHPGTGPEIGPEIGTSLTRMTLSHDPASDSLQVSDHDGEPVAFSYTGAVPQHLLRGVSELVCLLSNPWLTIGRVDRDRLLGDHDTGRAEFQPRAQTGRIVWARARWSFPVADVPQPGKRETPVEFFTRLRGWRVRNGLPDEVFVSCVTRTAGRVSKQKPQWLGFDHPHSAFAALGSVGAAVSTVDFTEALPARAGHWVTDPRGDRVATEFQGLVRHA